MQAFNLFTPTHMEALSQAPGQLLELTGNNTYLSLKNTCDALKLRVARLEGELKGSQSTAQYAFSWTRSSAH